MEKQKNTLTKTEPPKRSRFNKITKKEYEKTLIEEYGYDDLTANKYQEVLDGEIANMTLYYHKEEHIGTWQTGSGWFWQKPKPINH